MAMIISSIEAGIFKVHFKDLYNGTFRFHRLTETKILAKMLLTTPNIISLWFGTLKNWGWYILAPPYHCTYSLPITQAS